MNEQPGSTAPVISARGLVKHYEGGRVRAVNGVDLRIAAGEFVAVCGPSGCGKTTLLNLIAGIDRPDAGTLCVAGHKLMSLSEAETNTLRRSVVGLVFQLHNLLPDLTAVENVEVPMIACGRGSRRLRERARALLERVGLSQRADALPTALSGGERQRVAIARALANKPRVLLADEPTGAIDSENAERLLDLLEELMRELCTTVVVVTHNPQVAARAGRVLHMLDGRITNPATPPQVAY